MYLAANFYYMAFLDIFLIALGLAMDSFAVSITAGLILKKCKIKDVMPIAVYMGFFQGVMPIFGWLAGKELAQYIESFDHWIAFVLLVFIGGKMIYENAIKGNKHCFNPKKHIVLLGLAFATSIDALIIGVNFGLLRLELARPILIIGITTFILSFAGVYLGGRFQKLYAVKMETIGGIVLIGIACKIVFEHIWC